LSNPRCYAGGMKNIRNSSCCDLIVADLNPKLFLRGTLFYWLVRPRHPILASDDPLARLFIQAMLMGEPVEFIYIGGSKPGSARKIHVSLVFQHELKGRIYVSGYCFERAAHRVFALDLIMVIHAGN
jgi:hypothetical protein